MTPAIDPGTLAKAVATPRWSALVRLGLDVPAVVHWDPGLLRESRVLVPVDVQALYVPPGSAEPCAVVPFALTEPDGSPAAPAPAPFADAGPRPPGVHLHWSMPDALLDGTLATRPDGTTNRLGLPALPDRWLVLRLGVPAGASSVAVTGWVLCADTGTVVPLAGWSGEQGLPPAARHTVAAAELTGSCGGSVQWASVYDAVVDRFAFHDDLADLAPGALLDDHAGYLVTGWWSHTDLDPLDAARTDASLHESLERRNWHLVTDEEGDYAGGVGRAVDGIRRETLGLRSGDRFAGPAGPAAATRPSAAARAALGPVEGSARIQEAVAPQARYEATVSPFADLAQSVVATEPRFPRSTLLHGSVHGVPVAGPVPDALERRPAATDVGVVLGHQHDDVVASAITDGFGVTDPDARRSAERLIAGLTGHLLDRLATPDGVVDIEEHEHSAAFTAFGAGTDGTDRVRMGDAAAPLIAGAAGRGAASRAATAAAARLSAQVTWAGRNRFELIEDDGVALRREVLGWAAPAAAPSAPATSTGQPASEVREIARPAPRHHVPAPPLVALRGAGRNLSHRGDGRFNADGLLRVRRPSQIVTARQLGDLAAVLPGLGTGAVPDEVLSLAREAVLMNPYWATWLADALGAAGPSAAGQQVAVRLFAEHGLRYGANAVYNGRTAFLGAHLAPTAAVTASVLADQVRRFSVYEGVDPDPVGVTLWSQPWRPLWLEWEAELTETDPLPAWTLGQIDLEPPPAVSRGRIVAHTGRSVLTTGVATTMAAAITGYLDAEDTRDQAGTGEVDEATEQVLAGLRDDLDTLDVVSAALDGWREQLLGLPYRDGLLYQDRAGTRPRPVDVPELVTGGELRLRRARLVDAFGRVLDLPDVATPALPAREEVPADPDAGTTAALRIRPRLTVPARWMFRLVDSAVPATGIADAAQARVDQVDPTQGVNPVAGFLLPDHIDEALEVFDVAGTPLGQLMHEPFGGGVVWEPAPGRPLPSDAGPLAGLAPPQRPVGQFAAGLVAADAAERQGLPARPDTESALSALLRAIDTTLWAVDTFAALGSEHIAGLVGRPVAVVRARLVLEVKDDLADLDLTDPDVRAAREQAYRDLAALTVPVRLGELTRADDGLLGFFVDDDYATFHVVDKVVQGEAFDTGRGKGQLGTYGTTPQIPAPLAITNPYVLAGDALHLHPGQVVALTLLMLPAGSVNLTSGLLPRKAIALARDWVAPGLAVMAPSARIGPVLVDPARVALPLISAFPKDQVFTRRDTPLTWKDDPILAATQTALLPDLPHEVQEGYIRIAPAGPGS